MFRNSSIYVGCNSFEVKQKSYVEFGKATNDDFKTGEDTCLLPCTISLIQLSLFSQRKPVSIFKNHKTQWLIDWFRAIKNSPKEYDFSGWINFWLEKEKVTFLNWNYIVKSWLDLDRFFNSYQEAFLVLLWLKRLGFIKDLRQSFSSQERKQCSLGLS